MKSILPLLCFCIFTNILQAQKIVNLVYVGANGVTENLKETINFIVVKQFPDSKFERLDYKLGGPLIKLQTYNDSDLLVLNGPYRTYSADGRMNLSGEYKDNLRDKHWYYYNDTFKVIKEEIYDHGVLLAPKTDSVPPGPAKEYADEREAKYIGGQKSWRKFLSTHTNMEVAQAAGAGGTVYVGFRIDKEGKVQDIFLRKSAGFLIDEESIRVIGSSPDWIPAFQNGRPVNAYRVQPLTFSVE